MLRIENMFLLWLVDNILYKAAASPCFSEQTHTLLHSELFFPFLWKILFIDYESNLQRTKLTQTPNPLNGRI